MVPVVWNLPDFGANVDLQASRLIVGLFCKGVTRYPSKPKAISDGTDDEDVMTLMSLWEELSGAGEPELLREDAEIVAGEAAALVAAGVLQEGILIYDFAIIYADFYQDLDLRSCYYLRGFLSGSLFRILILSTRISIRILIYDFVIIYEDFYQDLDL